MVAPCVLLPVLLVCSACQSLLPSPFWPSATVEERAEATPKSGPLSAAGTAPEWAADPLTIERALRGDLEVRGIEPVEHGQTLTKRLTVYSASEDLEFRVKWKAAKRSLDGVNNAPRREIAAYQVQRLALDPVDYVVPTTTLRCLAVPPGYDETLGPINIDGARCTVGAVSLWLEHVRYPVKKIDWDRFRGEPRYAYYAANLNMVGILMDHSDTHTRNLLVSEDPANRRMFSIDNGIAFNSWFRSPFSRDWNRLRVPALRAESIGRLRRLERQDLQYLAVLAELRRDPSGIYQPVSQSTPVLGDHSRGVRVGDGVLQLGLTSKEIEAVWRRIQRLLALVDAGRIAVF